MKFGKRKCKQCGEVFQKTSILQSVCSIPCSIHWAEHLRVKRERQEAKQAKAETREKLAKLKPLKAYADEAQAIYNTWIRLRDEKEPCISCGRFHDGQWHAGHYRSRGAAGHLRFHEDNCHKQCQPCNAHLSGNIVNYRPRLIAKIGIERVEALENDNKPHKWTKEELIEIKQQYKLKLKQLKQERL